MQLLDWEGIDATSLRDVIENMRKIGALAEIVGTCVIEAPADRYDGATAEEVMREAGSLVEALGVQALALLDHQGIPLVPKPLRKVGERTARRRAA